MEWSGKPKESEILASRATTVSAAVLVHVQTSTGCLVVVNQASAAVARVPVLPVPGGPSKMETKLSRSRHAARACSGFKEMSLSQKGESSGGSSRATGWITPPGGRVIRASGTRCPVYWMTWEAKAPAFTFWTRVVGRIPVDMPDDLIWGGECPFSRRRSLRQAQPNCTRAGPVSPWSKAQATANSSDDLSRSSGCSREEKWHARP